ncbi:MAG TPA: glutamate synthase (NADPH), homotetrameric [Clostridiales bacterium]|nr:glutamate synthase (NADPH), homotetrameric [Clostridiales bacterium]HBP52740.1 glutamate synthase (NADPH), homotetrameric [Clostridiales bacterium]HCH92843.1 glutamate synthase (NADPH), homotetrameric [Clostridiales bacterium]
MIEARHRMPTQSAEERKHNFDEVALGYTAQLALDEAQRCLNCKNAPCMSGCPVGVRIPDFIAHVKKGDMEEAYRTIKQDNNLPAICGRVCPQENQCEKHCVRKDKLGGSVAIGNLERYVADYAAKSGFAEHTVAEKIGKRVAIVGSGPSSLSCAADLARAGVDVTIFEALHEAGGVLVYGIPEFRLPKSLVKEEIEKVCSLGVKIEKNVVVGKTVFIDELLFEYDAVFIGSGAGVPMLLKVKGENLNGVYSANEYLTRINLMKAYKQGSITPIKHGKNVVVVGAGNVAMDSARTALRMGANVKLVYRRGREEMPARKEEINHAEEEGVEFMLLSNPVEILGDEQGNVCAIKCVKMQLGEPDASGRRSPVPIEGSEFVVECDEVIVALGTSPNPIIKRSFPSLETTKKGTIVADENGLTNIPRLYVGGDAMTGAATVILAMGAGKRSAKAILESFKN